MPSFEEPDVACPAPGDAPDTRTPTHAAGLVPDPALGAAALIGLVAAVGFAVLPEAILLPAVDRHLPWALGQMLAAAAFLLGFCAMSGCGGRWLGRRALLAAGALATGGALLVSLGVPSLRAALASGLRDPEALPYYVQVTGFSLAVAVPVFAPLGALAAATLARFGRAAVGAALLGAAIGAALAPWCAAVLLGPERTLAAAAILAAAIALRSAERVPRRIEAADLPPGSPAALFAVGVALVGALGLLSVDVERGPLTGPGLVALLLAAAALGTRLPAAVGQVPLLSASLFAIALGFPAQPWVPLQIVRDSGLDFARLAIVALPTGLLLGCLLGHARAAPASLRRTWLTTAWRSPAAAPLAVCAGVVVSVLLLPRVSFARDLLVLAGLLALLGAVPTGARGTPVGWLACAAAALAALLGVGRAPGSNDVLPTAHWTADGGSIALVTDPGSGAALVAVDGRAPFGRSPAQARRFAHLPLLLHAQPERVLVVSDDRGETASAAWAGGVSKLHWLRTVRLPLEADVPHWPGEDAPTWGPLRQFLAVDREPYDVIVLAPDARVGRRAAQFGTREFYALTAGQLRPDGLLCQWWDLADADITMVRSALAAASAVYPAVYVLLDHPRTRRAGLGLLASRQPLRVDPFHLDERLAAFPMVGTDLSDIGLDGLSVAALITLDHSALQIFAPQGAATSDARAALGVAAALRREGPAERLLTSLALLGTRRRDPGPWLDIPDERRGAVHAWMRARHAAWAALIGGAQSVVAAAGPTGRPFDMEGPGDGPEVEALAWLEALAMLPDWDWLRAQVLGHARRLLREGREAEAEHYLRLALARGDTTSPPIRYALGALLERRGQRADALTLYRSALAFDAAHEPSRLALLRLGEVLDESED